MKAIIKILFLLHIFNFYDLSFGYSQKYNWKPMVYLKKISFILKMPPQRR
jgi:hypothetical protein